MRFRKKPRAGIHAEQRYQDGLQSWRTKNRRPLALLIGILVVATMVGVLSRDLIPWAAGLLAGASMTMWMVFRETPPRYVEKWRDGAEGEWEAEKALRPLERSGWRVFHDVQNNYGNYDHIVVGPTGLYLLESKNFQGIVTVKNGAPRSTRRHDPSQVEVFDRIKPAALGSARRLSQEIQRLTGKNPWVQAVVVFWSEFPDGFAQEGKCVFIEGSRLCSWLQSRTSRLSKVEIQVIAAGVEGIVNEMAESGTSESEEMSLA
jgi:hypothetical protein